jgi:hypothetical protein
MSRKVDLGLLKSSKEWPLEELQLFVKEKPENVSWRLLLAAKIYEIEGESFYLFICTKMQYFFAMLMMIFI